MKCKNSIQLIGLPILCFMLHLQISGQSSVLVLKGNVMTPVPAQNNPAQPANTSKAPTPAAPQSPASASKRPNNLQVDYSKRVLFLHNLVFKKIPQRVIDSFVLVNHSMLDSIRSSINNQKDGDSIKSLKAALTTGVNDSLMLVHINNLLNPAKDTALASSTGSVNAFSIDLDSQAPMDSVKLGVFRHDSLIATAYSGQDGFCKIIGLKPGEYSLSFSKAGYTSFSDRWVKVIAANVTYLEMPLTKTPRFYLPKLSIQAWGSIIAIIVLVFVAIFFIMRRRKKAAV